MERTEHYLKRQIERIGKRIQAYEEKKETLSVHGYWSLGYYRGKLTAMEVWLDDIQSMKEGKQE